MQDDDTKATYRIVCFRFKGENYTVKEGLTLEEAQEHCTDPSTKGKGWFHGYTKEDQ